MRGEHGGDKVTLRTWLALLNFKANERNIIIADEPMKKGGQKIVTIVTSANAADAGSGDDNAALKVDDQLWKDAITNESIVAQFSGAGLPSYNIGTVGDATGTLRVTLLRDEAIRDKVLEIIEGAKGGDTIDLMLLHLSDRGVIRALIDAANRGVHIRIILDPNTHSFNFAQNGIPNTPAAKELTDSTGGDIKIAWCDTHGETCNAKFMMGKTATSTFLLLGSANFTRRNLQGFNLEADIFAERSKEFTAWKDAGAYFDCLWNNTDSKFTAPYEVYRDDSFWRAPLYRMMERTGLSSF